MRWLKDTGDEDIDNAIFAVEIAEDVGFIITREGEGRLIVRGLRMRQYARLRARIGLLRSALLLSELSALLTLSAVLRSSSTRAAQDEADLHRVLTALLRAVRALFGQDTDPEFPTIVSAAEFRVRAGGLFREQTEPGKA